MRMTFEPVRDYGEAVPADHGPIEVKKIPVRGVNALTLIDNVCHFPEQGRINGVNMPVAEGPRGLVVRVDHRQRLLMIRAIRRALLGALNRLPGFSDEYKPGPRNWKSANAVFLGS
jgi:hypothetical protein